MPLLEEYTFAIKKLPFVFRKDLIRTPDNYTKISNWHEDIEIEYFKEGNGIVIIDGKVTPVAAGDFIFIRSNEIHQLIPYSNIKYSCLIIDSVFCTNLNFSQQVKTKFNNDTLSTLFSQLEYLHDNHNTPCIVMKQYCNIINQLIILNEHCTSNFTISMDKNVAIRQIQDAIKYIRDNFSQKICLDELAKKLFINKFILSKKFKEITQTTIIEYLNIYRCKIAAEKIINGVSVSEAAYSCGYTNMSYFTKTFKRYYNCNPSQIKKQLIKI